MNETGIDPIALLIALVLMIGGSVLVSNWGKKKAMGSTIAVILFLVLNWIGLIIIACSKNKIESENKSQENNIAIKTHEKIKESELVQIIDTEKNMTIKQLKQELYLILDQEAKEVSQNNPMIGTPMAGFEILERINDITNIFKLRFKEDSQGLSEEEVEKLISEIYTRVYIKYLE